MKPVRVVHTHRARAFFHIGRTYALARDVVAIPARAHTLLTIGKAEIARFTLGTIAADHVLAACALTAERTALLAC